MTKPTLPGITPWLQRAWDMRAAGNFIGGGTGTGLLIAAAFLPHPALTFLGLAFVALGLASVFLEIGRPLRAANVLLHPHRSWMTREAYVAAILFPLGAASLLWVELAPFAALPAALYLYCQARILTAAKGIPAWRDPLVVPLILSTGLVEGLGLMLVFALFVPVGAWAHEAFLVALAARLMLWLVYRRRMAGGKAPAAAAAVLTRFSVPFTLGGTALPLALIVAAGSKPDLAVPLLAAAGLAGTASGWALKACLVTRAAFNQGFAILRAPTRGAGRPGGGVAPGW